MAVLNLATSREIYPLLTIIPIGDDDSISLSLPFYVCWERGFLPTRPTCGSLYIELALSFSFLFFHSMVPPLSLCCVRRSGAPIFFFFFEQMRMSLSLSLSPLPYDAEKQRVRVRARIPSPFLSLSLYTRLSTYLYICVYVILFFLS